jgi:hypothetical protein
MFAPAKKSTIPRDNFGFSLLAAICLCPNNIEFFLVGGISIAVDSTVYPSITSNDDEHVACRSIPLSFGARW